MNLENRNNVISSTRGETWIFHNRNETQFLYSPVLVREQILPVEVGGVVRHRFPEPVLTNVIVTNDKPHDIPWCTCGVPL